MVEQEAVNFKVRGSNPRGGAKDLYPRNPSTDGRKLLTKGSRGVYPPTGGNPGRGAELYTFNSRF